MVVVEEEEDMVVEVEVEVDVEGGCSVKRVDRIAEIMKKLVLAEEEEEESQLQVPFRSLSILRFL